MGRTVVRYGVREAGLKPDHCIKLGYSGCLNPSEPILIPTVSDF